MFPTTVMNVPPLVAMRGIRKRFPGALAVDDVDFELREGEVHALAGENGSGKSTLVRILYGALTPDEGRIEIDGEPVAFATPRDAIDRGIVAISQELTLAPTLNVAENVLMGRLPRRKGVVDWSAAHRKARSALEDLGVVVDTRSRVDQLSIDLQQEVEIARAVSSRARMLVLDEATSSLSEKATARLLELLDELRRRGVAIVFVSHRLRELYQCASRVTVLRDGRLIGTVLLAETTEQQLMRMMVGRALTDLYDRRTVDIGKVVLSVRGLATGDGRVLDASFNVRGGEIVGVAGLTGCGKVELGLALAGALRATGRVEVRGSLIDLNSPRSASRAGIGFVPDDRKRSALLPTRSVQQNLSLGWMSKVTHFGAINVGEERRLAERAVQDFSIRTPSLGARIVHLSGGNQQKVVLARCFALAPDVIVLSEPTRGIDVGAKSEVYRLIQAMVEKGAGVLLISSEIPELVGLTDRILVMFNGRIHAEFDPKTAAEEEIAHAAFGGGGAEAAAWR
jgi:ribose transport system ATP-binding protein